MRILQLCHKPPRPSKDGGCRAMDAMSRGILACGHELKILSIATDKHPADPQAYSDQYIKDTGFESVSLDTNLNRVDAFSTLITGDSYNISRFYSPDFERVLIEILSQQVFDIVIFESLFTAPYLKTVRRFCDGPAILRAHNVEHRIWQLLAEETNQLTKKYYLRWLADRLQDYEINSLNDFDAIAAISERDIIHFKEMGCDIPLLTVPFGLDIEELPPPSFAPVDHVFHLGAMDWRPNIQGIQWFLNRVWPIVIKKIPNAKLHLAGRNFPVEFPVQEYIGVHADGEVDNAWDMMTAPGIMIIPLLSGSGMRIKAIEAMAAGRPIVSTSIGVEGIHGEDGVHFHVADAPEDFANRIVGIWNAPEEARAMGQRSREFVLEEFENKKVIRTLLDRVLTTFEL